MEFMNQRGLKVDKKKVVCDLERIVKKMNMDKILNIDNILEN